MIRGGRSPRASEAVASALGRPFLLLAVVVLVANDHWLKAAFPGTFTGKLSDFAGPVVVMSLLAALLGRTPAAVLTAAGFVALKTAPGVAEAAKPLLGGVTRRDPSDLVGLLVLPFVWRALGTLDTRARGTARTSAGREARPQASAPAIAPSPAGPDHRSAAEWIRKVFPPVAGAALSTLALTATSQAAVTEVVSLSVTGTTVFAELTESDRPDEPSRWGISTDGGSTWEEPEEEVPTGLEPGGAEACRSDGRCYAARGGTIDEMAPGGGWTTSFQLSEGKRELLEYRRSDGGADPDEMFESVVVVPGEEGENVVVSARDQGVVVLDASGRWRRVSVLDAKATSTNGSMAPLEVATMVLLASLPVALLVAAARAVKRGGGTWAAIGSTVGALLVAVAIWAIGIAAWALGTFTVQNPIVLAIVLLVLSGAVVLLPLGFVRRAIPDPSAS